MRFNRRKMAYGAAGAGAILALGIAVPNLAFAQDQPPAPSASTSAQAGKPDWAGDRAKRQDEFATALAKELGVDKDKVAAALAKVEAAHEHKGPGPDGPGRRGGPNGEDLKTRLDDAVKAGKLTQAEADAIIKAADAGVLGPAGRPHGGPPAGK